MKILTLDIGGANTKKHVYKDGKTKSSQTYFPVWKKKDELKKFLSDLNEDSDYVAVTTTAELCDVFSTKEEGARFIVSHCKKVFGDPFFLTVNQMLVRDEGIINYREVAAANWLASIYLLEKRYGQGILLDVGSTTTDILPFGEGTRNLKSDLERIKAGQLVYTGLLRTPVNTIVSEVSFDGSNVPIASEYFAITADVCNLLWGVEYTSETPDGKGKSKEDSKRRIARLLCSDVYEVERFIVDICSYVHIEQVKKIAMAIKKVSKESGMREVYVAGVGRRLGLEASELLNLRANDLERELKHAWNLPCLGLVEMVLDMGERR